MQINMGVHSCGLWFSVTHHKLDNCDFPGIVAFFLELFSWELSCEREKQHSVLRTYVHLF